jgi:hypothetical protein
MHSERGVYCQPAIDRRKRETGEREREKERALYRLADGIGKRFTISNVKSSVVS